MPIDKFNIIITAINKEEDIIQQIQEEARIKNKISQLLIDDGYRFAICDDDMLDDWTRDKLREEV